MKPLRVLHIINSLEQGGAELHLLSLFRAYDPAIIKPSIITLYPTTALAPHFESLGFPITSLGLNSFNDAGRGIAKLIGIISATKPDIIHTALLHSDFIGRIAAKLCGYNQIITALHSPVYSAEVMNANPQLRLWKLLVVRTFDWFTSRIIQTHFVGCSAYVMKAIQPALDLDPSYCNVIYNGVHLPHLNYKKQERKVVV